MQKISYKLRCRPSWWIDYEDPKVFAEWKAKLLSMEKNVRQDRRLTADEIDYILEELFGYEKMRDEGTGIQPSCFARVYESDILIPEELRQKLITALKCLEDMPPEPKNWRPRTDQQVVDVLDPCLYCGVYGRTFAYPLNKASGDAGPKEVRQLNYERDAAHVLECPEWAASKRFTWIPTDFDLTADGQSATALGYIGSIHPHRHSDLYTSIEELVARFSSLWDRVLTDLHPDNPVPYRITDSYEWGESEYSAPQEEEFDDYDDWRYALKCWRKSRQVIRPTIEAVYPEDISKRKAVYSVKGRKIQVFVRLFDIILTPENPEYLGERWHVEGMANERIVACGIICCESENTTETTLSVRTAVQECRFVDNIWEPEYGLHETGDKGMQVLGSVETLQGRAIAFPNIYQSQMTPFELFDRSKPGYRRFLALYLVDPECTIPSTTNIAPQQADWIREAISMPGTLFARLPTEILNLIVDAAQAGGVLETQDEAEGYKLETIEEREACVAHQNEHYFEKRLNFDAGVNDY
ncbi:hypothetical protein FRC00_008123 [Tulasnella sp. 408]|nr:hypothetical protein FRC00_008123 [Tulasnella sp. 408]